MSSNSTPKGRKLRQLAGYARIPIFNDEYAVHIVWGDKNLAERMYKKVMPTRIDLLRLENNRGVCFYERGYHPFIYVSALPNDKHFFATIAHEAVHAIEHIFNAIGQPLGEEIFGHCVGAVVANVEHLIKSKS